MPRVSLRAVSAAACALWVGACNQGQTISAPTVADSSCGGCHSAPGGPSPFHDQNGSIDTHRITVGAHDAHLHGDLTSNISCDACHTVPRTVSDPGHLDAVPPTVNFSGLALTPSVGLTGEAITPQPAYVNLGCAATYCHGNFAGGNRTNTPTWLAGGTESACDKCHGLPPPTGRHEFHVLGLGFGCPTCHDSIKPSTHVNGVVDVSLTVNGVAVGGFTPAVPPAPPTCQTAQCHGGLPRAWTTP
jgi:predicted CxxxxCH...CXXCH cytochrome family protein